MVRWTHNRCTERNKSPTVSNGIGTSSFEILTANLAVAYSRSFIFGDSNWKFCKVGYPVGTLKPDIQMRSFFDLGFFFMLLFLSEKNLNLLDTQEHCICKLGKI